MKRRAVRRLIGALLIVAALVVYLIPSELVDADSATASTTDFHLDGSTLEKYTGTAVTVSIPDTVKKISNEAFADNTAIQSVVIPNTVEEISYAAFSGCSNLKSVSIPDKVERIETAAFCNCSSLETVSIGSGLKEMGTGVFTGCDSLSEVKFSTDKFICENGVILDKKRETIIQVLPGKKDSAYSMPNTVTMIYPYSFYGCKNINAVTLSSTLEDIPAYSFSNCNSLESIIIPYSVNNIDAKAFENCVNLGDVEIPESVSYIQKTAFDGCPKLNFVTPTYSYAYKWFQNMDRSQVNMIDSEDNAVEAQDTVVKDDVSSNTPNYSEPSNVPETFDDVADHYFSKEDLIGETIVVGRRAFVFIDNKKQTVLAGKKDSDNSAVYSELISDDISEQLLKDNPGKGLSLPKFTVVGSLITTKAYYGDKSLDYYEFPENIDEIGAFAFARSSLKKIVIPEGVTSIGYGAFYHCDDLAEISVPLSVTNIEPAAFSKTACLENWMSYGKGDYLILGDGILVAYRGKDSKIIIPEGIKQIGPEAFMDHMGITDLFLPDSLERICEDAFSGCSNLKNVSGGVNLKRIDDRAFSGCPVETVRIVDSVENIGLGAFDVSATTAKDETKAVVFLGDELPSVSIRPTSTRLANSSFRKDALSGVKVAIVNNAEISADGTVLDKNLLGFSGIICVITDENDEYHNGKLSIVDCTLSKDEARDFDVPSTMIVFGKGYNFDEAQLADVIEKAKSGDYEKNSKPTENKAVFEGDNQEYDLLISFDEINDNSLLTAYVRIFGEEPPANIKTFNIGVRDVLTDVNLTKFGRQKLDVCVDIPEGVPSANIHVVCLDDSGQLEDMSYKLVDADGKLAVLFDANHTGKYGIYSYKNTKTTLGELDDSPETGDFFSPKTFLSLGLLFAGLCLLFIKRK